MAATYRIAVLYRFDLGGELVFVAILLEIALELEHFHEAVAFRSDLIDGDILGPAKMGVHPLQVLGCEGDFHAAGPFFCVFTVRSFRCRPNEP